MKLVDILARELKAWPGNYLDVGQADGGRLHLPGLGPYEKHTPEEYTKADDWWTAIVTREQWQAAVDALSDAAIQASAAKPDTLDTKKKTKLNRSNDDLAILVASKTFYRFGNLFWGDTIRRKDLVGKLAGSVSATDGYRYVKCGKARNRVAAHRVIFLMHHGYLPEVIDHVNRIRDDNRIENLRDALTEGNNQGNQSHQLGRSSKYKGVCWDAARGKWSAYIKKDGQRCNLGRFASEETAAQAYNEKAAELFGDFANLNEVRTPEQIAAEERTKAIDDLVKVTWIDRGEAALIYDAGYRKQASE